MSYKFNPISGTLDYFESSTAMGMDFYKHNKIVDSSFLISKTITLSTTPLLDSEFAFLNGLLLPDDCYTVLGAVITFEPTLPFKVGHIINIRYAA